MNLSIITPVLDSHEAIVRLLHYYNPVLEDRDDTEFVLVDDGSDPPLDTIAREVCKGKGVPFIGLLEAFRRATEEYFHDGLHPTSEGHQRVFEKVKQFLEEKGWV